MNNYVRSGTCGACRYFEYEGENSKGYCNYYRAYYWPDDSCKHYDEKSSYSSGSGIGCFLTTACCEHKGLPDDCYELQTMRKFRDCYLKKIPNGLEMISLYYEDAPAIVAAIRKHPKKQEILDGMYRQVCKIVALIEKGENDKAVIAYLYMAYCLTRRFCCGAPE